MNIGIIGLGLVGRAIERRLLDAGHDLHGFDIAQAACVNAANGGVRMCESGAAPGHVSVSHDIRGPAHPARAIA